MRRTVLGLVWLLGSAGSASAEAPSSKAPEKPVQVPIASSPYATLLRKEAAKLGLPVDIADAVMAIESAYDPTRIGSSGEIGLMQVMPSTAAMLGFSGTVAELAVPATNIHYGVTYLSAAWQRAGGNLCRALMKYRAGHAEEVMTPLSVTYCSRARDHLASIGSDYAGAALAVASPGTLSSTRLVGIPKLNRKLRGDAFWAVQEARVRALTARVHRRWKLASR